MYQKRSPYLLDIYWCPSLVRGQVSVAMDVLVKFDLFNEQLNPPLGLSSPLLVSHVWEATGGASTRVRNCVDCNRLSHIHTAYRLPGPGFSDTTGEESRAHCTPSTMLLTPCPCSSCKGSTKASPATSSSGSYQFFRQLLQE